MTDTDKLIDSIADRLYERLGDRLAEDVADRVVAKLAARQGTSSNGQLRYTEAQAAQKLAISPFTLRDHRLAGKIDCHKQGRRIFYTEDQLAAYTRNGSGGHE